MMRYDYVLIGGGMAAHAAYEGIRSRDATGSIGWFSADVHPPYRRPPLSKGLWQGDDPDDIWYQGAPDRAIYLGQSVVSIAPRKGTVTTAGGETFGYGRLLLATGGTPRRLEHASDDLIYFRTVDDYRRLRGAARRHRRFLVIGGGFIGTELAAALRTTDRDVVMLVREPAIGARVFPAGLATEVTEYYRDRGVTVETDATVTTVARSGQGLVAQVSDGRQFEGDVVVAGVGLEPNTTLAGAAGLAVSDGIDVDAELQTSERDIYAAGDVANVVVPPLHGRFRMEHEHAAVTMGRLAGRNMTGAAEPYVELPFFYSDLFDLGYEAVGDLDPRDEIVEDWVIPGREGVVYYLRNRRVRGVLLWNVWGRADAARELITAGCETTAAALLKGRTGRLGGRSTERIALLVTGQR